MESVEIVRSILIHFQNGEVEAGFALLDDDALMACPFSPPPTRNRWHGRAEIEPICRRFFGGLFEHFEWLEMNLEQGRDPAMVFGTGRSRGVTADKRVYENEYAWKFVVRDGKVAEYWEWFNPLVTISFFDLESQDDLNLATS